MTRDNHKHIHVLVFSAGRPELYIEAHELESNPHLTHWAGEVHSDTHTHTHTLKIQLKLKLRKVWLTLMYCNVAGPYGPTRHFCFVFCTAEDKVCIELACTCHYPTVFTLLPMFLPWNFCIVYIHIENISEIFGLSVFLNAVIFFLFFFFVVFFFFAFLIFFLVH